MNKLIIEAHDANVLFLPLVIKYFDNYEYIPSVCDVKPPEEKIPCSTLVLAVRSSLPTVTRTGSRKNVEASLLTASGQVALTV